MREIEAHGADIRQKTDARSVAFRVAESVEIFGAHRCTL